MQILYDIFPVFVFFLVYKLFGIYWATASAMVTSLIQVIAYRLHYKKFEHMQVMTLCIIFVLGSMTLLLHSPTFIKWKPTVINWAFGLVFLVTKIATKKSVLRRMMETKIELPDNVWRQLNSSWVAFFFITGLLNIYVAYHFTTDTWVNFKLFGMTALTLLFVIGQSIFLAKHIKEATS